MEIRKSVKFIIIFALVIFISPVFCYGYSNETTHPALSNETIDIFNYYYPDLRLDEEERSFILEGSKKEDQPEIRCVNHFYDPINNKGLLGVNISAKDWSQSTVAQAGFSNLAGIGIVKDLFSSNFDYSWDRAIYDYVYEDKNRALEALGHTLHLIQDMSVPPHVRDDQHMTDPSPYEAFTKQFNKDSISSLSDILISENKILIIENNLDNYFYKLAKFTNENFFSRSTINKKEYVIPEIVKSEQKKLTNGDKVWFSYEILENDITKLVAFKKSYDQKRNIVYKDYFLDDWDNLVLTDYWNILSKQAVLHGAGVIKLFFDEVEKEKQTLTLYNKNKSFFAKIKDKIVGTTKSDEISDGLAVVAGSELVGLDQQENENEINLEIVEKPVDNIVDNFLEEVQGSQEDLVLQEQVEVLGESLSIETVPEVIEVQENIQIEQETSGVIEPKFSFENPGNVRGGGGSVGVNNIIEKIEDEEENAENNDNSEEQNSPEPEIIITSPIIVLPENYQQFTANSITFSGNASSTNIISTNFSNATTTVNQNNEWLLNLENFNQGTTTISFYASNENQTATSTESNIEIFVDSEGPNISLEVLGCEDSISQTGCLITTNETFNFSWDSASEDLSHFILNLNGVATTTTATTTQITLTENQSYTFSVKAVDNLGNESEELTQIIQINQSPVVINEVAWMGTKSSAYDEWIELYNNTNEDINLENWVLYSEDQTPYIPLSGDISAKGYYLLERTDDSTIGDVSADLIYTGGLSNSGENLNLVFVKNNATTTVDQIFQSNNWNGNGNNTQKTTMERYESNSLGTDWGNWGSNLGEYILNGTDVDGNKIYGTPKARNSMSYLITNGTELSEDKILTKDSSPYFITRNNFVVKENITLSLEPGVVVKFAQSNTPSLKVNGTINSSGTEAEPVVFTSVYDDEFGGDTNRDGICDLNNASSTSACPQAGDWKQILINSTNNNSSFDNTIFRYGGKYYDNGDLKGMVAVDNTDVDFSNSIFENSYSIGLNLSTVGLETSVLNNIFRFNNNENQYYPYGVWVFAGSPNINNNLFTDNAFGLYLDASSAVIDSNEFNNNTQNAISGYGVNSFSNNFGSGNGVNGILVDGYLTTIDTDNTLNHNLLPYIFNTTIDVAASSALNIDPNVIIKFEDKKLNIYGELNVNGEEGSEVVFTHIDDDSDGVDVKNDGENNNITSGKWRGVYMKSGSVSSIKNAEFRHLKYATSYENAPISLENVTFRNNEWAVFADGDSVVQTATNIIFDGTNSATSTAPLW